MFDVFTFAVESIEKSETTSVDWLSWDENTRMIIEFDFRACLFVENMIDSMIDHFVDVSKMTKNDSFRFLLI
jgi:tRNA U38,U39,U40 pseudouridine synthase TruA